MSHSLTSKAISGVAWTGSGRVFKNIADFIVFALLARLLSPDVFGLVAYAAAVIFFLQILVEQGMSAALVQKKTMTNLDCDSAFWMNLCFGLILSILIYLLASPISYLLNEPELSPLLKVLSIAFAFPALGEVQKARLTRAMDFKALTVCEVAASVVGGLVGITAAVLGAGVWALVLRQLALGAVSTMMLWFATNWRPSLRVSFHSIKELFYFGGYYTANRLVATLGGQGDVIVVGLMGGKTSAGLYSVAMRLITFLWSLLSQVVGVVALPTFSQLQTDRPRFEKALNRANSIMAFITFPAYAGLSAVAFLLIPFVFGDEWAGVSELFQVLAVIGIPTTFSFLSMQALRAMGIPHVPFYLDLVNVTFRLSALSLGLYFGDLYIGVIALAAQAVLLSIPRVMIFLFYSKFRCSTFIKPFVVPFFSSLVMAFSVRGLSLYLQINSAWLNLTILVIFGGLMYSVINLIFNRRMLADLMTIANDLVRRIPVRARGV